MTARNPGATGSRLQAPGFHADRFYSRGFLSRHARRTERKRAKSQFTKTSSETVLTPLTMSTASFDTDLGYETLCSKIELNSSSSSSPSKGGYESIMKNNPSQCYHYIIIALEQRRRGGQREGGSRWINHPSSPLSILCHTPQSFSWLGECIPRLLKNAISFLITVELLALLLVVRKQLTYTILKTFGFIFLTEGEFNRLLFAVDPRFRRTYGQQQKNERTNERTFIYIPHISHHVSWRLSTDRPQHRELRALLFSISGWVL